MMASLSDWHRWDLHIHTPETLMNDNFTDKKGSKANKDDVWQYYVEQLNNYNADILGITDYFSANNFFKLRDNRTKWKLKTNIVIFPNIEMRANDLVSKKQEESQTPTSKVNIHFIFRPDVPKEKITRFLREVRFKKGDGTIINVYGRL